jgi:putative copper export protein
LPNWLYLLFHFLYTAGLAIWIGGAVALGALAAPQLFGALPRAEAGAIFGPILRRFSRLRVAAVALVILGAGVKYVKWESHAATPWIALRWVAIAFLAFTVSYEIVFLEPALARRDEHFPALHKRSEMLMKASLIAALVALFFS